MYHGKPIIGIAGGIGSGKSFVARLFGELGCLVIDSDAQVRDAYNLPEVKEQLRRWWGAEALNERGEINRSFIAGKVFSNEPERQRLQSLLHPLVNAERKRVMAESGPEVAAFVWDTPLLFEAGRAPECDAVIFVESSPEQRLERVSRERGWNEEELRRREILQWPLDKKRLISDYVLKNTADADELRGQVREVLSRILAVVLQGPEPG